MQVNNINFDKILPLTDEHFYFLDRNMPKVVKSDGTLHVFDGERIKHSMLNEIKDLPEDIAHYVTLEVSRALLGHEIVTAPNIREIACGVLHRIKPIWRFQYTRLGIPYYNFKKDFGKLFDGFDSWEELDDDYVMNVVIPKMKPNEIVKLIKLLGKDYLGVTKKIEDGKNK